jgi:hypothetical protein
LPVGAHPLAAEAIRIGTETAVVGIVARMSFARTGAEGFAIIRIAALLAADQALQQIPCSASALASMLAIFGQLLGDGSEEGFLHQGGHRDTNPFLGIDIACRGGASGLWQFPAQRP